MPVSSFFPFSSLGQELLNNFVCSVVEDLDGFLLLLSIDDREIGQSFCAYYQKQAMWTQNITESKAVCRKDHLFVPLCLVPGLTGYGPKSVINGMYPSSFCFLCPGEFGEFLMKIYFASAMG